LLAPAAIWASEGVDAAAVGVALAVAVAGMLARAVAKALFGGPAADPCAAFNPALSVTSGARPTLRAHGKVLV
jgi:hypothetical protein